MTVAIIVLGMHRSGTSCLAGMLAAGGLASAGNAVRNWDNARGHHEMLDVIRLNEAVLAYSGGHWLSPPSRVRWTDEHAATRDRLLTARIDGRPPLLKDPRMLLTLPFWRASRVPYRVVAIVRHPLAVARSLESWREMPLADGLALWTAHNRALAEDRDRHGYALVDFGAPKSALIAAVAAFGPIDQEAVAAAYEEQLVHHDDGDVPAIAGLDEAGALYRRLAGISSIVRTVAGLDETAASQRSLAATPVVARLGGPFTTDSNNILISREGTDEAAAPQRSFAATPAVAGLDEAAASRRSFATTVGGLDEAPASYRSLAATAPVARPPFPRAELAAFTRLLREGANAAALVSAGAALALVADAAAVLVPVVTALVRARAHAEARQLIEEHAARLDDGLADLLHGKALLAMGDAASAVRHLEAACAVPRPFFQARHLLPQALRGAGRHADAREAMRRVASDALYPHGPLATLAEWSWLDGDRRGALAEMQQAIAAAPLHRRGRLRTRLAEWLLAQADPIAARSELLQAIDEDPGYGRSREVLASIG